MCIVRAFITIKPTLTNSTLCTFDDVTCRLSQTINEFIESVVNAQTIKIYVARFSLASVGLRKLSISK